MTGAHILDVVWIDFDGIRNEIDGILRIASQLYFRRCYTLAALEAKLKDLLARLRQNSIVVLDNIVFTKKSSRVARDDHSSHVVSFGDSSEGDAVDAHQESNPLSILSSWDRFILHVCTICKEFNHISFVVVSDSCESLEPTITFKEKLVVSSVSIEVASNMASKLVPDPMVSLCIFTRLM